MRGVPIVAIEWWRKAHPRLGLRVGGCRHIALLIHCENTIPGDSSTSKPCNRRENVVTEEQSLSMLLKGKQLPFSGLREGAVIRYSRHLGHYLTPFSPKKL